ncbi:ATP-grasp domain-containing protein, partial [Mordavella massiliensis]|uniref:ATP-grasp domain-containing protein n=1 Tax=Mordavella massiliensis TaxID=1871024 RepID=UPI0021089444|nr:ATP-grasp domain-containing protein [Mordavella massiliensis]
MAHSGINVLLEGHNFARLLGGLWTTPFAAVKNRADLNAAVEKLGYPCVLKTCEGGYDGHGQMVLKSAQDLDDPITEEVLQYGDDILEGWVPFKMECSVMVAR